MPNTFAYLVLFAWPLAALMLFRVLPKAQALIWAILAAYLLLPERTGLNLPGVPVLDKTSIPSLMALVLCVTVASHAGATRAIGPGDGQGLSRPTGWGRQLMTGLLVLGVIGAVVTVLQNAGPVVAGPQVIQGLRPYDMLNILGSFAIMLIPFLLAQRYLATPAAHRALLVALVLALAGYSLLALYEVRMSPQMNRMVYGFFPHSWIQHIRGGGFRPLVFLNHGLWLGVLFSMAVLAACALWRDALRARVTAAPWLFAAGWLMLVLVISRNLGATAMALLVAPVILFTGLRAQLLVAGIVAGIVLGYPALRGAGWVPTSLVVDLAAQIEAERAGSLRFRLNNEDILLARANEKPLGGWGTWGRNRVYDPDTGRDLSTTDGYWVIIIGNYGWLGYLARFGLLTVPLILLALGRRREDLTPATAGLALVLAVGIFDLIPNATISPVTWMVAGALAGYAVRKPVAGAVGERSVSPRWQAVSPGGPLRPVVATGGLSLGATAGDMGGEVAHHHRRPRA